MPRVSPPTSPISELVRILTQAALSETNIMGNENSEIRLGIVARSDERPRRRLKERDQ